MKRGSGLKPHSYVPGAGNKRTSVAGCQTERHLTPPWPAALRPNHIGAPSVEQRHTALFEQPTKMMQGKPAPATGLGSIGDGQDEFGGIRMG